LGSRAEPARAADTSSRRRGLAGRRRDRLSASLSPPPRLLSERLQTLSGRLAAGRGAFSIPLDRLVAIRADADAAFVRAAEQVHAVAVAGLRALPVQSKRSGLILLESTAAGLVHRAQAGHGPPVAGVGAAAIPFRRLGVVLG